MVAHNPAANAGLPKSGWQRSAMEQLPIQDGNSLQQYNFEHALFSG